MPIPSTNLTTVSAAIACSATLVLTGTPDRGQELQLLPEWAPVGGVVASMSQAFDPAVFERVQGPGARLLIDERSRFVSSIAASSPEVAVILLIDDARHVGIATQALGRSSNLTVIAEPSWVWMRDFAPLSARLATRGHALVAYTPFMREVSETIARRFGAPLVSAPAPASAQLEGGNILVDGSGRCYTATRDPRDLAALEGMCHAVRIVPPMPLEPTGHIDVFARLLNDSTALVADYADEDFHLAAEPVQFRLECTDAQIRSGAWSSCRPVGSTRPDAALLQQADRHSAMPITIASSELRAALADLYGHLDPLLRLDAPAQAPARRRHLDAVAQRFAGWGFRVVRVDSPRPYVSLDLATYVGPDGSVVRRVLTARPVFPSYTNSLMVNGLVYVPQYATATPGQNRTALARYGAADLRTVPVDLTQSIALRGAARCLTTTLPSGSPTPAARP